MGSIIETAEANRFGILVDGSVETVVVEEAACSVEGDRGDRFFLRQLGWTGRVNLGGGRG